MLLSEPPAAMVLPLLKPPSDLLNRLRWVMLLFAALSLTPVGIALARSQAAGHQRLAGLAAVLVLAVTWVRVYRRAGFRWVDDALTAVCLVLVSVGAGGPTPIQGFFFATFIFTLFYPALPQAALRAVVIQAVYFGTEATLRGGALPKTMVLSTVGFTMASLFTFLLARAIERQAALTVDLERREARFRALVQNGADVVLVTDAQGIVTYQSPAAERVLGLPPDALVGHHVSESFGMGIGAAIHLKSQQVVACDFMHPAAGHAQCEAFVVDQLSDPAVQGIVVTARDVTERNRTLEALRTKELQLHDAKHEIDIAARLQTALLPRAFEVTDFTVAARMVPATEVGGDYYDVVPTPYGCWVGIGDVAGHGLDAGLMMLMTQSVVGAWVRAHPQAWPSEVLSPLNRMLFENVHDRLGKSTHVTFTLLHLLPTGAVRFAGAHEELLVWRRATQTVEALPTPGTWLGLARELPNGWPDSTLTLSTGDVLLLHTDGITESRNPSGEELGIERMEAAFAAQAKHGPRAVVDALHALAGSWSERVDDDRTVVAVRFDGAPAVPSVDA